MHYFMVPAAKEILFSTGILFIHFLILTGFFPKAVFFREIFRFCQIQGHFQDRENEFVIFQVFYDTWEPRLFVKPHGCSIDRLCTSSKLSKASNFNSNITTIYMLGRHICAEEIANEE